MAFKESVKSLHTGDVVTVRYISWPLKTTMTGPVFCNRSDGHVFLARHDITHWVENGLLVEFAIVSRAEPPFYVNYSVVGPRNGDVVRDADDPDSTYTWHYLSGWRTYQGDFTERKCMPERLLLLVDGATGKVRPE